MEKPPAESRTGDLGEIVKGLLFELEAETPLARLGAILRLQGFLSVPEVRDRLEVHVRQETDDECRLVLTQILGGVPTRRDSAAPQVTSGAAHPAAAVGGEGGAERQAPSEDVTPQAWLSRFRAASEPAWDRLLGTLRGYPRAFQESCLRDGLVGEERPAAWGALFRASGEIDPDGHAARIQAFLQNAPPAVLLRAYPRLLDLDPAVGLPSLPRLLLHRSLSVRIMAVRTLQRLYPTESLRLLKEMAAAPREEVRMVAVSLMLVFPFPDIAPILLMMLEEGLIPGRVLAIVLDLVRNNPDPEFLDRVAEMFCRRGEDFPEGRPIMKAVAESMALVGLESGTPGAILGRALQRARDHLAGMMDGAALVAPPVEEGPAGPTLPDLPERESMPPSKPSGGEAPPVDPSLVAREKVPPPAAGTGPRPDLASQVSGKTVVPEVPATDGKAGDRVETDPAAEFLKRLAAGAGALDLVAVLPPQPRPDLLNALAVWMEKTRSRDSRLLLWVEKALESAETAVIIPAMELLSRFGSRILVPHLATLCFHDQPLVVNQAIRHFRRLDEAAFLQRINVWIDDARDPRARRAALTGLSQMRFSRARPLVLKALQKLHDPALLEGFGNLLLVNPEADLVVTLQGLAGQDGGPRREFLQKLADRVAQNLRVIRSSGDREGPLARFLSREQIELLLAQVRAIHFEPGGGVMSRLLGDSYAQMWLVVLGTVLFTVWIVTNVLLPGNAAGPSRSGGPAAGGRPTGVSIRPGQGGLGEGFQEGTLVRFDQRHQFWLFRTDDHHIFQVSLPAGVAGRPNDRVAIRVEKTSQVRRGRPVYTVKEMQALSGRSEGRDP